LSRIVWARIDPFDKETAVAALEAGVTTLVVPEEARPVVSSLGRVTVVSPGGDLREGRDYRAAAMTGADVEAAILASDPDTLWLVAPRDGEVIPLENLVAHRRKVLVEARSPEEVALALGILETGVHGVVLRAADPAAMRALAAAVRAGESEEVPLVEGRVTSVELLGLGDRVCVDTCSLIEGSRGMLVGNSSAGLFLVCAENVPNPYVLPRPFRVNAGAVHSYCRAPGGRTSYLADLEAGTGILLVGSDGRGETATVGRVKVERRPLILVRAEGPSGRSHSVILQNAETIRLVGPGGGAIPVSSLGPGDALLLAEEGAGRHFGIAVNETIRER
jgi:3-dehydroquinate synthase II